LSMTPSVRGLNRFYHECGIFGQTDRTDKLRTYVGLG
jgi:hypothetical protein